MATHRISIFGPMTIPDNSGDVFFEPFSVIDDGVPTPVDPLVLAFNNSGNKDGVRGSFPVPENYVGTAILQIIWTADAVVGTCRWDWTVTTRSGSEDMGGAVTRATENTVPTKGGTAFTREEANITLTDADYAAGDEVLFELFRDSSIDTMAAKSVIFGAYFKYNDA